MILLIIFWKFYSIYLKSSEEGVPQGNFFSPNLFTTYTSDFPTSADIFLFRSWGRYQNGLKEPLSVPAITDNKHLIQPQSLMLHFMFPNQIVYIWIEIYSNHSFLWLVVEKMVLFQTRRSTKIIILVLDIEQVCRRNRRGYIHPSIFVVTALLESWPPTRGFEEVMAKNWEACLNH